MAKMRRFVMLLASFVIWGLLLPVGSDTPGERVENFFGQSSSQPHSNNWAVLVCASRFWFNYRHVANALSMYHTVKRLGIPDSNIVLMLADDMACNARNVYPGVVVNDERAAETAAQAQRVSNNMYGSRVEVDYRGYDVTVENLLRLLVHRHHAQTAWTKRLNSDARSNILIYMTGHGGDGFLKFQDDEELSSHDLADAFHQMHLMRRYQHMLFIVDTCQANTMYAQIYSPNILGAGSSAKGENSYSHGSSGVVGVAIIDRYTFHMLSFLERVQGNANHTVQDMFDSLQASTAAIGSTGGLRTDLFARPLTKVPVLHFFGAVHPVMLTTAPSLPPLPWPPFLPDDEAPTLAFGRKPSRRHKSSLRPQVEPGLEAQSVSVSLWLLLLPLSLGCLLLATAAHHQILP